MRGISPLYAALVVGCVIGACSRSPAELAIRAGYPSISDFQDLPSLMAFDMLKEQGYAVEITFFAQSELAVESLAQGMTDIGFGSDRTHWAAVHQGAPIVTVMEQVANAWSVMAVREIEQCAHLDRQRLAIHSEGSVQTAMLDAYLQQECPQAQPEILIIPGSENRAAALLAGEIQATPLELGDVTLINMQAADRFHILVDFSQTLPDLLTTGVHVNREFAAQHPQVVLDYLTALLQVHRRLQAEPTLLGAEAAARLGIAEDAIPAIIDAHMRIGAWDPDGGMTAEAVDYSLKFYVDTGSLSPSLTPAAIADLSFLEQALSNLGHYYPQDS
jgi:NitT/TauT family transport system substrate-binding protein